MRPLAAIGVVAVAAGFLVAFDAGVARTLDLSSVVVTLIGLLGIAQGVRYANARRTCERASVDLGEPERREQATVPGADLDEEIARAATRRYRGRNTRERVRGRVRSVTVRAIVRSRNCSVDHADSLVESGEWTEDRTAAAFLSTSIEYPLRVRIRRGLLGRSTYAAGVSAAVEAAAGVDRGVGAPTAGAGTREGGAGGEAVGTTDRGSAGSESATRDESTETGRGD